MISMMSQQGIHGRLKLTKYQKYQHDTCHAIRILCCTLWHNHLNSKCWCQNIYCINIITSIAYAIVSQERMAAKHGKCSIAKHICETNNLKDIYRQHNRTCSMIQNLFGADETTKVYYLEAIPWSNGLFSCRTRPRMVPKPQMVSFRIELKKAFFLHRIMRANGLATQGCRASPAVVFIRLCRNNPQNSNMILLISINSSTQCIEVLHIWIA